MVTVAVDKSAVNSYGQGAYYDIRCISDDDKPLNVPNGSTCMEIDTGKVFLFDAENSQWNEI